jgi:hypothetical protein
MKLGKSINKYTCTREIKTAHKTHLFFKLYINPSMNILEK